MLRTLALLNALLCCSLAQDPDLSARFDNFLELRSSPDPELYELYWSVTGSTITFAVRVQTNGWIGFGISPNGLMLDSDVVMGFVDDTTGAVTFNDRRTDPNIRMQPAIDAQQDWNVLAGSQARGFTTLEFVRSIDTGDTTGDRVIGENVNLIWSFRSDVDTTAQHTSRGSELGVNLLPAVTIPIPDGTLPPIPDATLPPTLNGFFLPIPDGTLPPITEATLPPITDATLTPIPVSPGTPSGLSVVLKPNDATPVKAVISWMALMDNATGILPGGNQTLRYFVEVSNSSSAVLFSTTVDHPNDTVEAPNLPACENLTVSVTADNQFFNGTPASEDFMTVEPDAISVSLSPMEDPVNYFFRAATSANNTIMLNCSWDAEAYYVAWLKNGVSFYGEDRVRGVEMQEYGNFNGTTSVTADFIARRSTLQVTDAFITDSANYTCAVACHARDVVRGIVLQLSEEFSATREVLVLAILDDLMATLRRPTYMVVVWTALPNPFRGNYLLTYGPSGGMTTFTTVPDASYNITGLQPFTNYTVTVQASNAPVVEFGSPLSGVFSTLPEAIPLPGVETPSIIVPQVGTGSSAIVEIVIPAPAFLREDFLSHMWVVCIRNILPETRSTAPDTALPDSNTIGTYDNAEDNVLYIASEFDAGGINFPHQFGVGNESEPNDFPGQYRNGPVMAGRTLDCFVRYFVSTERFPARRRRDAFPNRQYDIFQSTGYATVNIIPPSSARPVDNGLIAALVGCGVIATVAIPLVIIMLIYLSKQGKDKNGKVNQMDSVITGNPNFEQQENANI